MSAGWPGWLAGLLASCWLAAGLLLPTRFEPLERRGGHYRDHTTLILGLSVQTSARVFHALPGARASRPRLASQHAIPSTRPTLLVRLLAAAAPLQQARVIVCSLEKGLPGPPRLHIPTIESFAWWVCGCAYGGSLTGGSTLPSIMADNMASMLADWWRYGLVGSATGPTFSHTFILRTSQSK